MAVVQFRHETRGLSKTAGMFAPSKKIQQIESWLKEARKVLREIPREGDPDWVLAESIATASFVRFNFIHRHTRDRCYVVIDRTKHAFVA